MGHGSCALAYSVMLQPIDYIWVIGDVHWVIMSCYEKYMTYMRHRSYALGYSVIL